MKFRKSRPSIAASIGRMIVLSIPKRPDASPERKAVAASTHSSAVTPSFSSSPEDRMRRHTQSCRSRASAFCLGDRADGGSLRALCMHVRRDRHECACRGGCSDTRWWVEGGSCTSLNCGAIP
jgi:hypothetical protein